MVRYQLLEDDNVLFGGYRVPHPLEPAIQVKVQTRTENPGPSQVTASALGNLINEVQTLTIANDTTGGTFTKIGRAHV